MFFPDQHEEHPIEESTRQVYLYENGKPDQKPVKLKLIKKKTTIKDIAKIFKGSNLRIYNSQGSEYFQEDLDFIKNGAVLYVSKGQQFDPASCFSEYQLLKLLGEGGFGKVYLAQHKQTKQKFAIKIIKTQNIESIKDIDSIFVEAQILKSLRHQNIVKVHKCLTMKNMQVVIIMEFLQGGDLLKYVTGLKCLDQVTARTFIKQLAKGILYCHQNNLTHRDLKLENLLLVNSEEQKIKIIDFGISGAISTIKVDQLDTGSLAYMAPECFFSQKGYRFDGKIDVWAIGVILYAMLCGELPFKGSNSYQTIHAIKEGVFRISPAKERHLSHQCLLFLSSCLDPDPKTRISTEDLCNHKWLDDIFFSAAQRLRPQTTGIAEEEAEERSTIVKFKEVSNQKPAEGANKTKSKTLGKWSTKSSTTSLSKKTTVAVKSEYPKSKFR